jgi:CheY-like chemotaxis protein
MPRIWCSISGHGFGHGAQTIPILNELGRRLPDLHVLLRTNLPQLFLKENLSIPWELHPSNQDIGCVQDGPLQIDVQKTWIEYEQFQFDWAQTVRTEAELIRSHQPDLVISNITYLGVEAGAQSGIPTLAMGSLSWDRVLEYFLTHESDAHRRIIQQISQSYQKAQLMIRFAPSIPMVAFTDLVDVGPIAGPPLQSTGGVRNLLKMNSEEKLVLVAFGGIRSSSFPVENLEGLRGYRILIDGSLDLEGHSHVSSTNTLPVPFRQILAEADLIVTKPGYATVIEAVRNAIPVVYVRRYNFVDEQILVDYLHRFGRARELRIDQFHKGEWFEALETVQQIPLPTIRPPELGTAAAAEVLAKFL